MMAEQGGEAAGAGPSCSGCVGIGGRGRGEGGTGVGVGSWGLKS